MSAAQCCSSSATATGGMYTHTTYRLRSPLWPATQSHILSGCVAPVHTSTSGNRAFRTRKPTPPFLLPTLGLPNYLYPGTSMCDAAASCHSCTATMCCLACRKTPPISSCFRALVSPSTLHVPRARHLQGRLSGARSGNGVCRGCVARLGKAGRPSVCSTQRQR